MDDLLKNRQNNVIFEKYIDLTCNSFALIAIHRLSNYGAETINSTQSRFLHITGPKLIDF